MTVTALGLNAHEQSLNTSGEQQPPPGNMRLERRNGARKVFILGAGLSGLVAAYELMRAGHDVRVLEAQFRPGGRVHTLRKPFSNGFYAEAGAGRIPINHEWTRSYIREFRLTTEPMSPANLASILRIQNKQIVIKPDMKLDEIFDLSSREKSLGPSELADRYLGPTIQEILSQGNLQSADWPSRLLSDIDRYTIPELISREGASPVATSILYSGALPKDASALFALWVLAQTDLACIEKTSGGNDRLPYAIAGKLQGHIEYDSRVIRFGQNDSGVYATFLQNGLHHTIYADYMICALPFSILRDVVIDSGLSGLKMQAIQEMTYAPVVKVAIETPKRYWENEGLSGFAKTDQLSEIWSTARKEGSDRGILQLYQEGSLATHLDELSQEQCLHFASQTMQTVFPKFIPDVSHTAVYSWQQDRFAQGAYGVLLPGQLYSWFKAVASVEGRIHFAGEHTSSTPAFMQGAIASGHRAATQVNGRG